MGDEGLELEGVSFAAAGRLIVDSVSLRVRPGETLAVVGPSGCGKTTLLRLIAGLERPECGRILFDGDDLAAVPPHRRNFGMMFQEFALFPHLTVEQNIAFGLRHSRFPRGAHRERVAELLTMTGLMEFGKRTIEKLSGGERQRVALARALAPEPRLLMLDEPLGSLDRALRERLLVELKTILEQLRVPALYVTHDQFEAFAMSTVMAVMRAGRIVRMGTPREVHNEPQTEFVARFLGMENIVPGERRSDGLVETACGDWQTAPAEPGPVQLLIRDEQATLAKQAGLGVATGVLRSRMFQGNDVYVGMETAAGELRFRLEANEELPPEGTRIFVHAPRAQVLAAG
ncbi:MAG: iron ABC transporter ATP-binding protein [Anaerolinea sp.]|nr:iron ABC transporter ATP-binding protein [Anaerolinea sp.]